MKHLIVRVAGVTYPNADGESRQDILRMLTGKEPVQIRPEPTNPYDANALAVYVAVPCQGDASTVVKHVGYIPRQMAAEIAPQLDGDHLVCTIRSVTGGFDLWREDGQANYGLLLDVDIPDETVIK